MKKLLCTTLLGLSATLAMAEDKAPDAGGVACPTYPPEEVMPQDALNQRLAEAGYQVSQIETKDNCYHVMAKDPDGQDVTLFLDMKSGQVVNPEQK